MTRKNLVFSKFNYTFIDGTWLRVSHIFAEKAINEL